MRKNLKLGRYGGENLKGLGAGGNMNKRLSSLNFLLIKIQQKEKIKSILHYKQKINVHILRMNYQYVYNNSNCKSPEISISFCESWRMRRLS